MAEIRPFTPLRYDSPASTSPQGRGAAVRRHQSRAARGAGSAGTSHNVVKLILPTAKATRSTRMRPISSAWRQEGILVRDDEPSFYRYDRPSPARRRKRAHADRLPRAREDRPLDKRHRAPARADPLSGPKEDRFKLFTSTKTNFAGVPPLSRSEKKLDAALAKAVHPPR